MHIPEKEDVKIRLKEDSQIKGDVIAGKDPSKLARVEVDRLIIEKKDNTSERGEGFLSLELVQANPYLVFRSKLGVV